MAPATAPAMTDLKAEHPIASAWRPMLGDVVKRFAAGDYGLAAGVAGVEPVSSRTAEQIRDYIADYGCRLIELPDAAWQTSVARWMGTHWDILVDLWTSEEGRSDLVLAGRIVETESGPRFTLQMVCVP